RLRAAERVPERGGGAHIRKLGARQDQQHEGAGHRQGPRGRRPRQGSQRRAAEGQPRRPQRRRPGPQGHESEALQQGGSQLIRLRWLATAAALLCAVTVAACGFGPGASSGGAATLTVTRDYGAKRIATASVKNPSSSETVLRFLDREEKITTRYGGGFV